MNNQSTNESGVRRYDLIHKPYLGDCMERSDDGEYVLHDDYELLWNEVERLREALEQIIATESVDNDGNPVPETGACFIARAAVGKERGLP